MKAHYDIIQGSDEWHEIRYGKIGGTLASGLFIKSDNLLHEILADKTEEFELDFDSFTSKEMQRGNDLEPIAREHLTKYTGIEFKECGWLQCLENELMGISPDGINEDETIQCEIKCPGSKAHIKMILSNEIPLEYINQCLHAFTVNPKLEKLCFCSFRPENIKPLFVKELYKDSMINMGTNAKPVMMTVNDGVILAKGAALQLSKQVDEKLKQISF